MTDILPTLSDIRQVSDGWIKKYLLTYTLPDGSPYEYESVSRKSLDAYRAELEGNARGERPAADAVCIVPQTADGNLLLIREFRYPLNSWCIAFPAGLMDPGEELAECVDRELREETGYALRAQGELGDTPALEPLPQAGYSSTGLTDETVHVVFAQVEKIADAQPEPGEFIEPFLLPIEDIPRFLAENTTPIGTRAQLVLEAFARRR
ncbi:NUDIX hydrolase [Eggerthella sp. YY7918]|uniref:NUDIX hydrolase n=1 Tax=Eggerthella sp. (strain YY7918) TaxID=502558 RepID=UPI0002171502|nr:NUDIX hydrolase [Eggerthella sp. YY7918]BAK45427.1 NTP pyrophosphohydrolase including oxidative damage repair enzyme [Eggerthella sp. YY7918]